jgi:hypothetical protein
MYKGSHDVIRNTWGQALKGRALVRFFVGVETDGKTSHHYKSDEVAVEAGDDYNSLPFKTRGICQWALNKLVDDVFLCDTDTYVNAARLLACGYRGYDYAGKISKPLGVTFPYDAVGRNGVTDHIPNCYPWASGGFGYFLSMDAVGLIADKFPQGWAEDLWVGQVLGPLIAKKEMTALDLPANTYSWHYPAAQFGKGYHPDSKWMETMHSVNS